MHNSWWVTDELKYLGAAAVIAHIFWVIFSICLHELGHGWAAIRHGDRTPIETGHMTWNPLVHMGQMSLLMFAVVGIAWGLMPVSPRRMRGRHAEAVVSAAGPAVNIGLAIVAGLAAAAVADLMPESGGPLRQNLRTFFYFGCMLNIVLALFNLIPVPPLDGSRILGHYLPAYRRAIADPQKQMILLGVFLLLFFVGSEYIWDWGRAAAVGLIDLFRGVIP